MKKLQVLALVTALIGSAALTEAATQLNLRVEGDAGGGWSDSIDVRAGQSVDYRVLGVLSNDDQNEGLALFGFDVSYSCGDLTTQMAVSTGPCMENFEIPLGITNPAGFGGTTNVPNHLGKLVQVGGAVNTILNTADNASYPTGAVCLGLCWPPDEVVLATGSMTIPVGAQDQDQCTVSLSAVFANVIAAEEVEDGTFFSVEPTDPGAATPLAMKVVDVCSEVVMFDMDPPQDCDRSLPRIANNVIELWFDGTIAAPSAGQIEVRELLPAGGLGEDLSDSFTVTIEGVDVLRLTENGGILSNETWYAIVNTGAWPCVDEFKRDYIVVYGDANGDGRTSAFDANDIWQNRADPSPKESRFDINGDGRVNAFDANLAWNNRNPVDPPDKPSEHTCIPSP